MSTVPETVNPFTPFTKYAQFSGRSRRQEFWLFALINFVFGLIPIVNIIWTIVALIPGWALFFRRMHDTGRSGWNWLWSFFPVVGAIILLVYACQDSQYGANEYGPNPKGIGNPE